MFIFQQVEMAQKTGYGPTCWVIFSSFNGSRGGVLLSRHAPRALEQSWLLKVFAEGFWKNEIIEAG